MEIQVLQEELSKVLNIASHFVNTRTTLPILTNFLLRAEKGKLKVSATNLEMSVTISLGAKIEKEGSITVPAKSFLEIISNLNQGQVSLNLDKEELKITSAGFKGKLVTAPANDFPVIPENINLTKSFSLSQSQLIGALEKVLFSASLDETRPILTGVLFDFKGDFLNLVASDGFRLSKKSIQLSKKIEASSLVIPRSTLVELIKIAKTQKEIVFEIKKEDNQLLFKIGEVYLATRLIDGNFPDFEKIIPVSPSTKVTVDKEDLSRAVKLSSVFARDSGNLIKIKVEENKLVLTSESSTSGNEISELDAKVDGGALEISYNFKFIDDFLNIVEGEGVEIKLTDSVSPAIFIDPKDPDLLHLIMPVRVQGRFTK